MAEAFKSVAIVGGGPGGLVAAKLLDDFPETFVRTTIFEASPRLGGKVLTRSFGSAAALFEAGVAELYDYSHLGHDPLKELVVGLDLETVPMTGRTVILDEKIITNPASLKRHFGKKAGAEASKFYRSCAGLYSRDRLPQALTDSQLGQLLWAQGVTGADAKRAVRRAVAEIVRHWAPDRA